jgi:hypothetical protein
MGDRNLIILLVSIAHSFYFPLNNVQLVREALKDVNLIILQVAAVTLLV